MRIVLKISGELLAGESLFGIDFAVLHYIAHEIRPLIARKVEIGIVVGGGNMFRGATLQKVERVTGDQMGMLATLINALALRDIFIEEKIPAKILSAIPVPGVVAQYDRNLALEYMAKGEVVFLAGGTGNPLVTTDTALGLRGIELKADLLLKATNVDGIYCSDPKKNPHAKFFAQLTYAEALDKKLKVMDLAAFCLCQEYNMPLRVYNLRKTGALQRIIAGENEGTLVERTKELKN